MSTLTDHINCEIETLHAKNIILAQERRYSEIQLNLARVKCLEQKRSEIDKITELKELMRFLHSELPEYDGPAQYRQGYRHACRENLVSREYESFNQIPVDAESAASIHRKLFNALYGAIIEVNRKVDALSHKPTLTEHKKCSCHNSCNGTDLGDSNL